MALPLIVSSLLYAFKPCTKSWLLCVAVNWVAILMDAFRIQPETVSLIMIMGAGTGSVDGLLICTSHLGTMWFWAGLNKLLSPTYRASRSYLTTGLAVGDTVHMLFPWAGIVSEIGVGVLFLLPVQSAWLSKLRVVWPVANHALILCLLVRLRWNLAVWPWNVALIPAGYFLYNYPIQPQWKASSRWSKVLVLALFLYPIGYFVGVSDLYLSHQLYSKMGMSATKCDLKGRCTHLAKYCLEVPTPNWQFLHKASFDAVCNQGDVLSFRDPRTKLEFVSFPEPEQYQCRGNRS